MRVLASLLLGLLGKHLRGSGAASGEGRKSVTSARSATGLAGHIVAGVRVNARGGRADVLVRA